MKMDNINANTPDGKNAADIVRQCRALMVSLSTASNDTLKMVESQLMHDRCISSAYTFEYDALRSMALRLLHQTRSKILIKKLLGA